LGKKESFIEPIACMYPFELLTPFPRVFLVPTILIKTFESIFISSIPSLEMKLIEISLYLKPNGTNSLETNTLSKPASAKNPNFVTLVTIVLTTSPFNG